ncbi:MAG: copper transporter [Actinomycetota bacterium]
MINLRYHIVSITAVFLALGIGLTLGSTFLDRVTVDELRNRLEGVQERVENAERSNDQLTERVNALDDRDDELAAELSERALAGHLDDVPVLVVAAEGTEHALIDQTVATLTSAGADVAGTWLLTERWLLDDADEVSDLGEVLEVSTTDPTRLRRNAAIRVAELLTEASEPPPEEPAPDPASIPEVDPGALLAASPTEPVLIARLEERGFVDYMTPDGGGDAPVLLPGASARYVVVSDALPESGAGLIATALLEESVAEGVARVVAAQGEIELSDLDPEPSEDARRSTFVGPLRENELTGGRLSTVDHLDTAAGLAAVILALEDLAEDRTGHYGVASGAARLLPGPAPEA